MENKVSLKESNKSKSKNDSKNFSSKSVNQFSSFFQFFKFDEDDSNAFSQQYEKTLSISEKLQRTLPSKTLRLFQNLLLLLLLRA